MLAPPASELDALLAVKAAIDSLNQVLTGWTRAGGGNAAYCSWEGITCTDGAVTEIKFVGNRALGGVLPSASALQGLPRLVSLWLQDCGLGGELPAVLPPALRVLALGANSIAGTLPDWSSTALEEVYVWRNRLSGTLPPLQGLQQLTTFQASSNALTGSLPDSWRSLTQLRNVVMWSNALSGELPAWLGGLTSLEVLSLGGNALSGTMPPELGKLAELQELYLEQNKLSGPVPAEWSGMVSLTKATLWNNAGLTGCVPAAWQGRVNVEGSGYSLTDLTYGTGITGYCPAAAAVAASAAGVGMQQQTTPAPSSGAAALGRVAAFAEPERPSHYNPRASDHHNLAAPREGA